MPLGSRLRLAHDVRHKLLRLDSELQCVRGLCLGYRLTLAGVPDSHVQCIIVEQHIVGVIAVLQATAKARSMAHTGNPGSPQSFSSGLLVAVEQLLDAPKVLPASLTRPRSQRCTRDLGLYSRPGHWALPLDHVLRLCLQLQAVHSPRRGRQPCLAGKVKAILQVAECHEPVRGHIVTPAIEAVVNALLGIRRIQLVDTADSGAMPHEAIYILRTGLATASHALQSASDVLQRVSVCDLHAIKQRDVLAQEVTHHSHNPLSQRGIPVALS